MRGVLWGAVGTLLTVLCVAEGKKFPEILDTDSEHTIRVKRALHQMDIKNAFQNVQESDLGSVRVGSHKNHGLLSSNAMNYGNPSCSPGFTGSDCEYPICDVTNHHDHTEPYSQKITIDFYYAVNATQTFWIYIDLTMSGQEFQLQSDSGPIRPIMRLSNSNGIVFNATSTNIGMEDSVYTYEFLSPGIYMIELNADDPAGSLLVTYNAWTYLSTEIGGIAYYAYEDTAKRSDFPNFNVTFQTKVPTIFVAASVGLEFPGTLSTVSFFRDGDLTPHNVKLLLRYGCHFTYYTGDFYCPFEGYYFARIRGYDFEGHSFVRTHAYICEIGMPPTTPAPTSPLTTTQSGPINCMNGGVPITDSSGVQSCFCTGLYTGDHCGTPLCMNGGTARSSICICPDGYMGSHCQNVQCTDDAGSQTLIGSPILTFVIRTRSSMASVISQISTAVAKITSELEYDPPYVSRFGLVLFNNNSTTTNMYYTAADIVNALNVAAQSNDTTGNCTDIFFAPIMKALSTFIITNKSPIYVISDGLPQDTFLAEDVSRMNSYFMSPINFIYIEPDSSTGCPPFDYESPGFRAVTETSFRFSGIASFVSPGNRGKISDLLYTYMANTYHKSHLMFSDDQRVCQNVPQYITISVDALFHQLSVVIEGANISTVQFNAPDGSVVPATKSFTLGAINIYWLAGLQIGTWTVTPVVNSINFPCSVRAYAVEDPTPTTNGQDYNMVYGITPSLNLDAPERQPILNYSQSIVAHIENYLVKDPWSINTEILVYTDGGTTGGGRSLVMASNGVWRSGCSYELWFPSFYCSKEGMNLYFVIYVKDSMGNQIQRSGVFYCAAVRVTPAPSPGTCANGGIPMNGTCLCQPGWTGDYCTTRVCYNNGVLNPAGYCQCAPGTSGEFCEYLQCINQNLQVNFDIHNRHMMFILDLTSRNAPILVSLSKYITELVRDISSTHKNWIVKYFVVGVDSSGSRDLGSAFGGDVGTMQAIFTNASQIAATSTDNSTYIPLYEGIMSNLNKINANSFITIFTTAAPDERNSTNVINGYDYILSGRHLLNVYAATDSNGNYLSGKNSDWDVLNDLSTITTGRLMKLKTKNFSFGMKLIPTWYSSQVVYFKTFDDCTNNGSIFAPIDTFAQSIQIYLNGKNAASGASSILTVQQPNGDVSNLVTPVITDTANGFGVFDIRRPCDSGWEAEGPGVPYCFQAFMRNIPWNMARQMCTDAGGFLVDDMDQDTDDFLQQYVANKPIWIGLNSLNGTWAWDRGVGQPTSPYNGTTFGPWANGNTIDPTKPCVYRGSDRKWYMADCTTTNNYYVCQKYKYSQEFIPNDINDDDVPAGRWEISFASPGKCTIEVRVQSSLRIFSGFVTHVLDDYPLPDGISNSTDNRAVTHLVGVTSVNHVPFLNYAQIMDATNGTLYRAATYQYRIGCSYEYLSQNFTCPTGAYQNRFAIMHIGEDESGLPFQRVTTGVCQAPRINCRNGLYYNGQCYCDEYYQGTLCEVPICVNGGHLITADNTCQCPTGYTGFSCQFDVCFQPQNTTFSDDGKAFVVVIEATTQNQAAVQNFGSNLMNVLNAAMSGNSSNWFNQFILVTFDSNRVISKHSAPNATAFVSLYNSQTATLSSNNNCNLPLFGVITVAAATNNLPSQSILYLITTGGSSSNDSASNYYNAFNAAANTDIMVNYILVASDNCSNEVQNNYFMYVSDLAVSTDGNTFLVDANQVGNFAVNHLPTLYNGTILGTPSLRNQSHQCQDTIFYFPIGGNIQTIYLYVYAQFGTPSITIPDSSSTTLTPFYTNNNLHLYSFPSAGQGTYTLSINDPAVCMVQVRVKGGAEIYPSYISVPASNPSIGSHLDNSTALPTVGYNMFVLHIPNAGIAAQYAELWPTYSTLGEIQYVQLYRRFNCSYEWYSDPFKCDEDGYFVTVYGLGDRGAPWVRHFYTRCKGYNGISTMAPSTTPSSSTMTTTMTTTMTSTTTTTMATPGSTSPGQTTTTTTSKYYPVIADVVFIFDVSTAVSATQFQDSRTFILNALNQFNVGYQKGVQVGLFSLYGDDQGFPLQDSAFNGINSYKDLGNALNNAYPSDASNSGTGQSALLQTLKITMAPEFRGSGYRNTTQNHVLVYITTNSVPNPPTIQQASVILATGDYKIVAISYQGNGSNSNALQQLVGNNTGCVLTSATQADYTGAFAQAFTDKIFNAYTNGGNYC